MVNYSKKDRWWTYADPFDASHPSIALCSSHTSKSCQSSQLLRLLLGEGGRLSKHLSVDRWSGRSFTWPALLWRSAIRGSASALSGPHESTPRRHLHAFLHCPFKLRRLLHQDCTKSPGVFGMDVASVHFGAARLLYLDLVKSPHPPPSTAPLDARGWLYNALSLPIMFLTSPFQFSRGTGRSQNGKLPPCIGRHWMIIMAS